MALQLAPRCLQLAARARLAPRDPLCCRSQVRRPASCAPAEPPPCAPCKRAPRAACRAPAAAAARGLRVTCCAPAPRARPPCVPPCAPAPRSCAAPRTQAKELESCSAPNCTSINRDKCGDQLDYVARRLAAAESARRAAYERDVTSRAPPPAPAPAPYRLHAERECLCATDGERYAVAPLRAASAPRRCGTERAPPPPCPVRVEPFDRCELRRARHLDPCGHRPRIFLDIDRTALPDTAGPLSRRRLDFASDASGAPAERAPAPGGLTTRIMDTLRRRAPAACARRVCAEPCAGPGARRAGDAGWCARLASRAAAAPPCHPPTVVERLSRRPGGEGGEPCGARRAFHTSVFAAGAVCASRPDASKAVDVNSGTRSLEAVLRERARLQEAARGRVVAPESGAARARLGAGALELRVPPTAEAVRVRVSLDFGLAQPAPCQKSAAACHNPAAACQGPATACQEPAATCQKPATTEPPSARTICFYSSDSWLSIKKLHKMFAGGRKDDDNSKTDIDVHVRRPRKPEEKDEDILALRAGDEIRREEQPSGPCAQGGARRPCAPRAPCERGGPSRNKARFSSAHDFVIPVHLS